MKIEIKHKFTGAVIFAYEKEKNTIKDTIEEAVRLNVSLAFSNLAYSYLEYSNFENANFENCNFEYCNLKNCNLQNCNFESANFKNASLQNADFENCNFKNANLKNASLENCNLESADLQNASLQNANFEYSNLEKANLTAIKEDFFEILSKAPKEIGGLKKALINGNINGCAYEGDCCCLVGTIANVRGCNYTELEGIIPNNSRPAERWFFGIKVGDTPKNSKIAKITLDWINEYETLKNK